MSWSDAFGLYGVDVGAPGVADYARGAIISYGVGQGWSNNRVQREVRAAGLGISVGQLDPMVRAERSRQAQAATSSQLGVDYSTGQILPGTPPANWTGQYVHQVTVTYRTKDEAGAYELHTRTMGIKSSLPLSPMAASNAALDIMEEEPEPGGTPRLPDVSGVLTTQLTGAWYDTLRGAQAA
jgi:hypothetical protein